MTTAHVLDLIEHALDDCAVSNDAVRYNAEPPETSEEWPTLSPWHDCQVRELIQELGREMTRMFDNLFVQAALHGGRRERLRRMHTAHPARWRKP